MRSNEGISSFVLATPALDGKLIPGVSYFPLDFTQGPLIGVFISSSVRSRNVAQSHSHCALNGVAQWRLPATPTTRKWNPKLRDIARYGTHVEIVTRPPHEQPSWDWRPCGVRIGDCCPEHITRCEPSFLPRRHLYFHLFQVVGTT
jgi:hypothetical protein